jgi:hypothetical protein
MNPWFIVGFLVALIAVGAAGYARGTHDGQLSEHDQWVSREAKINSDVAKKIVDETHAIRLKERGKAEEQSAISMQLQVKLQEAENEKNLLRSAVRDGTRRLSIAARCPPGGSGAGAPAAAPGGRDGEARAELPVEASDFLVGLAIEADNVAKQLAACQAVILNDRVTP